MMEGRGRRYAAQLSPERSKVWTEPPSKHQIQRPQAGRVPVVYYLCKNRHLDHPHFIEVPISCSAGLHLKDVINRLVVLRGKRMPGMYSWSCKRSYKNGFVWQDLSEDDLILPAHGNEYILKGSELLDQTPPDRVLNSGNNNMLMQNQVPSQLDSSGVLQPSSSYSSPIISVREGKSSSSPPLPTPPSHEDDSPILPLQNSSQEAGSPNFGECRVFLPSGAQDASTQTDDSGERTARPEAGILAVIVSTGDDLNNVNDTESEPNHYVQSDDAIKKETSPSQTPSSASSGPKIDTLESLIRSEVNKFNSFRLIEEEEVGVVPRKAKMKRINPLLQLLTCGSTLVKDHHNLGFIRAYKPSFLNMRLGSTFPSSMTLRELEYMSEGPRVVRLVAERRDSCSRNLCENHAMRKEEGRESSLSFNCAPFYNKDISYKSPDLKENKEKVAGLVVSNGSASPIQILSGKPVVTGTFRSPTHDAKSSQTQQIHCKSPSASSFNASKRIASVNSPGEKSFREESERMIKIEERLSSGARIIIQSRLPSDYDDKSSGS